MDKVLASGLSPTADVCVILPARSGSPDVLDRVLAEASERACGTLVMPAEEVTEASPFNSSLPYPSTSDGEFSIASAVMDPPLPRRLAPEWAAMNTDELVGRIKALCELRQPLQRMREEMDSLRRQAAELTSGARERDEQLRLAAQIQKDLLPDPHIDLQPLSVHTLYLPADAISGDVYDISRLDEDRFAVSITDATGHGLPAALLSILIKHALRGKEIVNGSYRIIEPDELLERLNDELLASSLSQCQFVTAVHAVLDRSSVRIRWARGGAPYPVLIRPGSRPLQKRSVGSLIGVQDAARFEINTHIFQPGDMLLFYTDGLESLLLGRQASCADAAILETPWLTHLATQGPETALEEIHRRAASTPDWPRDDITIIAIHMNEPA